MIDFRVICIFILEAIVVAAVVKKWCARTARTKMLPIANIGIQARMLDGIIFVDLRTLISSLNAACEIVEKSQANGSISCR